MKRKTNSLWVEKYRPQQLDDFVGNKEVVTKIKQYIEEKEIPHLLFECSSPGTGKCLDYNEFIDIEMEVSDDEYQILKKFEIM